MTTESIDGLSAGEVGCAWNCRRDRDAEPKASDAGSRWLVGSVMLFVYLLTPCCAMEDHEPGAMSVDHSDARFMGLRAASVSYASPEPAVRSLAKAGSVLIGAAGTTICAWDVESGERLWIHSGLSGEAAAVAASADLPWFACGFDGKMGRVEIREVKSGALITSLGPLTTARGMISGSIARGPCGVVRALVLDPLRNRLIAVGHPALTVWSLEPIERIAGPVESRALSDIGFGPDGRSLVAPVSKLRRLEWWDLDGNLIRSTRVHGMVSRLGVSGNTIAYTTIPGRVYLADYRTGHEIRRLEGTIGPMNDLAFSPDGEYVFAVGLAGTLRAWEVRTDDPVGEISIGFKAESLVVDHQHVYVAGERVAAFVWKQ